MIIYVVINNYLEDILIDNIVRFELELYVFVDNNYLEILRKILGGEDFIYDLIDVINEFKEKFVVEV